MPPEETPKETSPLLKWLFRGNSSNKTESSIMTTGDDENIETSLSAHHKGDDDEENGGSSALLHVDSDGVSSGDEFTNEGKTTSRGEPLTVPIGHPDFRVSTMHAYHEPSFNEKMELRKKGLPLVLFKFVKALSCLSIDCWILLPVWGFIIVCGFLGFVAITQTDKDLVIFIVCGTVATSLFVFLMSRLQHIPTIPHEEDNVMEEIRISEGMDTWPKSPIAPIRGELIANKGQWFRDTEGRRLLLRGINCAGHCKLPMTPKSLGASHTGSKDEMCNWKGVSFVGRPFPLDEADIHLGRLRAMGYTFLRLLFTWEAVEHDGPGIYDEDYLHYLKGVVQRCAVHGISVFVDAHQDVWSRWTGGDGAPAWTLEAVGFALDKLDESGAALTQQNWDNDKEEYPKMVWNSNNSRLAAGTMWTLFFAGDDFAPKTMVDGEPIQQYLQRHFCNMLGKVAETLKDEPNVVGFDILNEPSVGFIGIDDIRDIGPNKYYIGWRVDTWSAIKMGVGYTCKFEYFSSFMMLERNKRKLNENNVCAWRNGTQSCIWLQNGVWRYDPKTGDPQVLKPNYFSRNPRTGKEIDFEHDYTIPFWKRCAKAVRAHMEDAIIFAEPVLDMTDTNGKEQPVLSDEDVGAGYVWAKHYYDGLTLLTKHYKKFIGLDAATERQYFCNRRIEKGYGRGIFTYMEEASKMGSEGSPVLIGECGIPFDLEHAKSKKNDFTDFTVCTHALNRTMGALEYAKVSFTLWCYAPNNTNKRGDLWNGENLSLFSKSQIKGGQEDYLFAGGRSLAAAIRPYPTRVAGDVITYHFNPYRKDKMFELVFEADHELPTQTSEIFIPKYQYPHGINVKVISGEGTFDVDLNNQTLFYHHKTESAVNIIAITKKQSLMQEIF